MYNHHQQQLFETLLGNNNLVTNNTSIASPQQQHLPSTTTNNIQNYSSNHIHPPSNNSTFTQPMINTNPIQCSTQSVHQPILAGSGGITTHTNTPSITNESLLHQQLLYNQLVLMNQALSQNILMNMTTPNNNNNNNNIPNHQQTLYNHGTSMIPSNNSTSMIVVNNSVQPPSLLSVLSSLTATNVTNNTATPPQQQQPMPSMNHNGAISSNNLLMSSTPQPYTNSINNSNQTNIQPTSMLSELMLMGTSQSSHNLHQEMEDVAKPWLFMLENMLKQRPTTVQTLSSMNHLNVANNNTSTVQNNNTSTNYSFQHDSLINGNSHISTNDATFSDSQQPQYSGFSRESNLSPSIFQELDDIIGSIDPNVDICEKLSFDFKKEEKSFNVIVKPEKVDSNTSSLSINNETMEPSTQVSFTEEKKKRSKRTGGGQGRGGNTGGKYLAESASREVSPTFDYFIHSSDNSIVTIVKADFDGIALTPHERCLCALLSKAVLPKEDLKSLITGPNSITLRCIISKWLFGKLDVSTSSSAEESTGSDSQQVAPLSMVCDPMGFTVNKSAKPTRLSVFVNDTLKLRIRPCAFEKSSLFSSDAIIADISIFDQNMMNLFIGNYSIEMRSAHYLTGLAGGLSKESDLSTTNIMNTPDICMELLSENSIIQFTEDVSKNNNKSTNSSDEPFDVCVSVRRDHHYKVKLPPIKEVSMSLGFGNTSPNSALNKKISFIQIVETDSQRPVCRSEPFWCRSKSRAEMEKKQNREAMQRKTVKKDGEKKRKPKSPSDQEKKRKLDSDE